MADVWNSIKSLLPTQKTPEQTAARKKLFLSFDPNGNGYLSVAEVHFGCQTVLRLGELTNALQPICLRAHAHAKNLHKRAGKAKAQDDDYITFPEFRMLLVYIHNYFELWSMFAVIDKSGDRRVELNEFKQALPLIAQWGKTINDAQAAFNEIDTNGGGFILFDEFAEWAIKQNLDMDGDDNL